MRATTKASLYSLWIAIFLFIVKFYAFSLTHSEAIFSDAIEGIVNITASLVALWVLSISSLPPDKNHPYGHGKVEFFSSGFEGGLIFFAGGLIIYEAIKALISPQPLHSFDLGLVLVFGAGIINYFFGVFLKKRGKAHSSAALEAAGVHLISDFITSLGVIVGLLLVKFTGLQWLDPVCAIAVALWLMRNGFYLIARSLHSLMDTQDEVFIQIFKECFMKSRFQGIIGINKIRILRFGAYHHIDVEVLVPDFWSVQLATDQLKIFEESVLKNYPNEAELHLQIIPCKKSLCLECDLEPCPIRRAN